MKNILSLTSHIPTADLAHKRVFLRADLNVPLKNGQIISDYRLSALQPTLDMILQRGGSIVLATHIGRPISYTANLSTSLLIPWFKNRGYTITYESDLEKAYEKSLTLNTTILLLENMRFFSGEKDNDGAFAQTLARLGDYYVNDAFGLLHRKDTSITIVPQLFALENRTIGLLIEKEIRMLNQLLIPKRPFVISIGGGKITDKLPLLYVLLDQIDTVLLCPAVVCTFLKALSKPTGNSLVDITSVESCKKFLEAAKKKGVEVLFPHDYQVAHNNFHGPLSITDSPIIPDNYTALSIGPKTASLYAEKIMQAKTTFFNGLAGDITRPKSLQCVAPLFYAMSTSTGLSVIGGGDSVAAAELLGYAQHISYLSTGGGATLAYLGGQNLPGLDVFTQS